MVTAASCSNSTRDWTAPMLSQAALRPTFQRRCGLAEIGPRSMDKHRRRTRSRRAGGPQSQEVLCRVSQGSRGRQPVQADLRETGSDAHRDKRSSRSAYRVRPCADSSRILASRVRRAAASTIARQAASCLLTPSASASSVSARSCSSVNRSVIAMPTGIALIPLCGFGTAPARPL